MAAEPGAASIEAKDAPKRGSEVAQPLDANVTAEGYHAATWQQLFPLLKPGALPQQLVFSPITVAGYGDTATAAAPRDVLPVGAKPGERSDGEPPKDKPATRSSEITYKGDHTEVEQSKAEPQ